MVGRCTQLELKLLLEVWMVQVLSQPEMSPSLKTGEWGIYAGKTTGAHEYNYLIHPARSNHPIYHYNVMISTKINLDIFTCR